MAGNHVDLLGEHDGKLDSFLKHITIITSHADAFMTVHFDSFQKAQSGYVRFELLTLCEVFFLVFWLKLRHANATTTAAIAPR